MQANCLQLDAAVETATPSEIFEFLKKEFRKALGSPKVDKNVGDKCVAKNAKEYLMSLHAIDYKLKSN